MMRYLLCVFCLFCTFAFADSKDAQKPIPPVAGQTKTSDKRENRQANKPQEITVNFPASLNVNLSAPNSEVGQKQEYRTYEESGKWADPMTWLTAFLVLANILLWLTTKTAANAALLQAKTGEKEFISTHRPRVILRAVHFEDPPSDENNVPIKFLFVNVGDTEAKIIGWDRDWATGSKDGFPVPLIYEDQPMPLRSTLNSGAQLVLSFESGITETRRVALSDIRTANKLDKIYYVHGRIIYEDRFGTRRETGFCRQYGINQFCKLEGPDQEAYEYQD